MFYISCLSGLKKMELRVHSLTESWAIQIVSLSKNCPSLTELRIHGWIPEEAIRVFQKSQIRPDCALTIEGYRCKGGKQCSHMNDCRETVKIHLNAGGFSMEILRPPLFGN
ncbi:NACHT, LRR and PYD domains-containing protein 1 homolog [Labeo rohita]|uniref:NACHT, LRR and PYD domains-containing protein 1 homolog n=1 Tax=Labeo rohita TaxID=84645 RepID=UPI0021E2B502|nr:NACHT, LRR and PYD domains-containing protein 1 homolog [Labeo rohita]